MAFPYDKKLRTAKELKDLRAAFNGRLSNLPDFDTSKEGQISEQLSQIARVLGRSAGNETTVYDNGSVHSGASSAASSLTLQVERALTQVLGRSPGRGADGFISALNSAFPTASNGQVMMQPARSLVSLHAPTTEGLTGQLSVEQANLYRQASIIGSDALKVLDGLTPFDPKADMDVVEALRSLIRSQIRSLIDEFGRLDEPRKQRVDTYFKTLLVKNETTSELVGGSLYRLGEEARLGTGQEFSQGLKVFPVTLEDETQVAGFELLVSYVDMLQSIWKNFDATTLIESQITGRYSERLSRASIMLPVIADSNASFMAAMDSIGFTASERRSNSALFTQLDPATIPFRTSPGDGSAPSFKFDLADITVNDFDEWVDRFTSIEAPSLLSTSGQFGLDFVTDQADTLFWTIGAVLLAVSDNVDVSSSNKKKLLGNMLGFERVQQTLSELVTQLDILAGLGEGSVSAEQPDQFDLIRE